MIRPMSPAELVGLREQLRELHSPVRTGPVQTNPYKAPEHAGGTLMCTGCGGVMRWPCLTRRLVDGEKVDLTLPVIGEPPIGVPWTAEMSERAAAERAVTAVTA